MLTTLGLFTRWALTLGGLLITVLVFGTAMRSDWNTVGVQMIYAITLPAAGEPRGKSLLARRFVFGEAQLGSQVSLAAPWPAAPTETL